MTVRVSVDLWRRLTGEAPPRRVCDGCGFAICCCLEVDLVGQLCRAGCAEPVPQFRAIPGRRFAWDLAYPERRLLIEIQGGTRLGHRGGHTSASGVRRDCEKTNLAVLAGWRCLVVTGDMVRDGTALATIEAALRKG